MSRVTKMQKLNLVRRRAAQRRRIHASSRAWGRAIVRGYLRYLRRTEREADAIFLAHRAALVREITTTYAIPRLSRP